MSKNDDQQVALADLDYFWTHSGVPCFMANRENIEEIIESLGFNIYYLICNIAEDKKTETKTWVGGKQETTTSVTTTLNTGIVKVVNNFVGRSVATVSDEDIYGFEPVRETATYNLPPIPRDIINKLDEFFRTVHHQHGTESIVILTFDPDKDDSSGWGVLVPEQTNTSVHCKYEADSIVEQKPDHVLIVGSVHSHPEMSAYASGTDHADQADFDGIHITYGWQKSVNNGATQYHIELQMSGNHWTMKPEDVFEDFTFQKEPDPEVIEWTKNVKKVLPPQGGYHTPAPHQVTHHQPTQASQAHTPRGTIKGDPRYQEYPDPKDPNPFLVIAEMDYTDDKKCECPSCGYGLAIADMLDDVCPVCDIMLCDIKASFSEVLSSASKYLRTRNMSTNRNYYIWIKDSNNQDSLMKVADYDYENDPSDHVNLISDPSITVEEVDGYFYEGFHESRTVCCDIPMTEIEKCNCAKTLIYDDIIEFDAAHPYDVYSRTGNCIDCEFYYSRACTPYYTAIMNFGQHGIHLQKPIEECSSFSQYSKFDDDHTFNYY